MKDPLERAKNPRQYDEQDIDWDEEASSGRLVFFWSYLRPYAGNWRGKNVLEIGSGSGWLANEALHAGAKSVTAVEPSIKNVELSRKAFPEVRVMTSSFEDFDNVGQLYDCIMSIMSISHIGDLTAMFKKVRSLLSEDGEFIVVLPDYTYFQTPRHGYKLEKQQLSDQEYAISVTRPTGTISDIVRMRSVYAKEGSDAGLDLIEAVPMKPVQSQIDMQPKFQSVRGKTIAHLFRFTVRKDLAK